MTRTGANVRAPPLPGMGGPARLSRRATILGLSTAVGLGELSAATRGVANVLVVGLSYASNATQLRLTNTVPDARAVAAALERLRHRVFFVEDPTADEMRQVVVAFAGALQRSETALVFYAGHAIQVNTQNYLLSADGKLVSIGELVQVLRQRARQLVLILDACRNDPFAAAGGATGLAVAPLVGPATRTVTRQSLTLPLDGLAEMRITGRGVKVIYSTDPGNVAKDGISGEHSPFARALLSWIDKPLPLDEVLVNVTREVFAETDGAQTPWVQGALDQVVYLAGQPASIRPGVMPPP